MIILRCTLRICYIWNIQTVERERERERERKRKRKRKGKREGGEDKEKKETIIKGQIQLGLPFYDDDILFVGHILFTKGF